MGLGLFGLKVSLEAVLVLFFLVVTAENVLRFIQKSYARKLQASFGADIRVSLYGAYLRASWPFWVKQHLGHMSSLLTVEANRVELAFYYLTFFFSEASLIIILLTLAFFISWPLACFFLVGGGILTFALKGRVKSGDRVGSHISFQNNAFQEMIQEHLQAAKLIKSSAMEAQSFVEFEKFAREISGAEARGTIHAKGITAISTTVVAGLLCLGLFFAVRVLEMSSAQILVMLVIFYRISPKMTILQQMWHGVLMTTPAHAAIQKDCDEARHSAEVTYRGYRYSLIFRSS
jgi:ATP-binding cassette, subfamily C, bacterial